MLKAFLTGTFIWNTPTYGEGVTYPGMNNFLTNYYGNGSITLDEYTRLAKEKFGYTDIDALGIEGLIRDDNGVKYVEAGGIGGGWNGKVMYANKDGDHTLVGMRYFADCNSVVKSHLVEYRFGKGGTWLGYKMSSSGRNIETVRTAFRAGREDGTDRRDTRRDKVGS